MALTVLLGGARSGKSTLAVDLARREAAPVVFLATAEAGDDEMAARILEHRSTRPAEWKTVEEPLDIGGVLADLPAETCVVIDCLTLWVANLLAAGRDAEAAAREAARVAASRPGHTIVVTNEVGSGIVPADAKTRQFRDTLGVVNATWVADADRSLLRVAGRALPLLPPDDALRH